MIGIVATLKVKDGMAAEFEAAAMDLVEAVNANEPDCLLYRLYRTEDEHTFVFMERYKDEAAGDFHRNSDHFKTLGAKMGPFMAGRPEVLRMTEVA
jgi:quinol monooxygenase YgiN